MHIHGSLINNCHFSSSSVSTQQLRSSLRWHKKYCFNCDGIVFSARPALRKATSKAALAFISSFIIACANFSTFNYFRPSISCRPFSFKALRCCYWDKDCEGALETSIALQPLDEHSSRCLSSWDKLCTLLFTFSPTKRNLKSLKLRAQTTFLTIILAPGIAGTRQQLG